MMRLVDLSMCYHYTTLRDSCCLLFYFYLANLAYLLFVQMSEIITLAMQSAALKEAIDDLEWPGSSIQIILKPVPPSVTFRGEGHGDLQVNFIYNQSSAGYET